MTDLVTKDHFTDLRTQIAEFKIKNKSVVFDYEADEKEARSYVATMRKSKTAVNNRHKEKKKFFLEEGRKIDAGKNELIADIDEMIAVHAEPLQAIKDKREAEEEAERQKIAMELDWDDALVMDDLFNREREIARKEAEQARIEEEKRQKEELEKLEAERIAREEQIKKDAEERAKKEAEEKIAFEQAEKERLIEEARQREEQAKIDAENAEKKRLQDIKDAEEKAEREKKEALAEQKAEQEAKEKAEAQRLAEEKAIEERKAANRNHQKAVNNRVLKKLMCCGINEKASKAIIEDLIINPIPEISINY